MTKELIIIEKIGNVLFFGGLIWLLIDVLIILRKKSKIKIFIYPVIVMASGIGLFKYVEEKKDVIPPDTILLSYPQSLTNSTSAVFRFSSTEQNSRFECQIDNENWSACGIPKTYTELSEGSHVFRVRAIDAVGNVDPTPATYPWIIKLKECSFGVYKVKQTLESKLCRFSIKELEQPSVAKVVVTKKNDNWEVTYNNAPMKIKSVDKIGCVIEANRFEALGEVPVNFIDEMEDEGWVYCIGILPMFETEELTIYESGITGTSKFDIWGNTKCYNIEYRWYAGKKGVYCEFLLSGRGIKQTETKKVEKK
jgi:hypothetical protein